jgi:hypothetical protein
MYLLTEQFMNGTVTLSVLSTGVDAETFKEAIEKIKKLDGFAGVTNVTETDVDFSYSLPNIIGRMKNEKLKII